MLLHPETKSVLLKVPDPLQVRELIPKSKIIPHRDFNIAVQHTLDAVRILRNLGHDVPAPISTNYNWPGKYKPFSHQRTMAEFLTIHRKCFNLSEMGTGKTASCLWAADWLMKHGYVRRALILSPLSTLTRVWMKDIFDVLMHRTPIVVHGTLEKRLDALNTPVDFYILNHDGVSITNVANAIKARKDIDLVIVDEGSMFRNAATNKYKSLVKMLRDDQRIWWLTGTPCPNAPTDAWAQARVISKYRVPEFFGSFKRSTMIEVSRFKWAPKSDAYKIAYEAMQPAVRFKKADCLDLPPVVTLDRECSLTKEQWAAFSDMKTEMIMEAKEKTISAVNAADKILKLRQILCGSIKNADGEYVNLPHGPRLELLLECIESASAKCIVVVPFKGIIQALYQEVDKHYSCAVLNGDVTPKARDRIIQEFKETPDPHVLLCHPKVMSHGLNLTEADTLVFYGPIYSNDEFQQVVERFNRAGQTRKMTVIRMGAHQLEWKVYEMIDNKRVTQENILSLYASITQ